MLGQMMITRTVALVARNSGRLLLQQQQQQTFASAAAAGNRVKVSTGLVGLPVDPQAREKLLEIYKQTLADVENLKLEIRKDIVAITKYRLSVVEKLKDPEQIENEIKCGQIEELVVQAKDELGLVRWLISNAQDAKVLSSKANTPDEKKAIA